MAAVLDAAAQPSPGIDHYLCYAGAPSAGSAEFVPVQRTLASALAPLGTVTVKRIATVCSPADVSGGGIVHPDDWQTAYRIRAVKGAPSFVKRSVQAQDRFGAHTLDVTRRDRLLVPSAAAFGAGGAPPYVGGSVRHYECYRARLRDFVPPPPVTVGTWFGTAEYRLRKASALCAPADKNGEDPSAPTDPGYLVCHRLRAPRFSGSQVSTSNQIRPEVLDVRQPRELCVPAITAGGPTTTSTSTSSSTTSAPTTTSAPGSTTTTVPPLPCGDPLSPPAPLCWGECPPATSICAAGPTGCECVAGSTPCGSARFPACDGVCGPGEACQVSATLGCTCQFEGIPCALAYAFTGTCGGVCSDGYECVGPFFTPDGDGCLCAPIGSTCHLTCGADPGGGNCPPGQQCDPFLPGGPCLCQ